VTAVDTDSSILSVSFLSMQTPVNIVSQHCIVLGV